MLKPFHVIATPDENGYTVTIPENPNVSACCVDAADIIPTATAAKEQDEQNRPERTAVCPKCRKTYTGYPATSRQTTKQRFARIAGHVRHLPPLGSVRKCRIKSLKKYTG